MVEPYRQGHDGAPVIAWKEVASFAAMRGGTAGLMPVPANLAGTGIIFLEVDTHDKENTNM